MPVQSNPAIQNVPTIAWDGAAHRAADIRKFVRFGWSFEVTGAIAADVVFKVQAAPASDADPCAPGAFVDVDAVPSCSDEIVADELATVTIPAGTPVGTICSATIPCRPNAFVRLATVSGTVANVRAILIRQGPKGTLA